MLNYFIFLAGFAIAAALAAVPAGMLLGKLGFSPLWGAVIFVLLIAVPFLPAMVVAAFPAVMLNSSNIALVGVGLKILEWTPVLALLWYFALTAYGERTGKARTTTSVSRRSSNKKTRAKK